MHVEVLAGDDWKILQEVRLRALKDSPAAFLATGEPSWGEAEWRTYSREGAWIVTRSGDQVIGILHCIRVDDRPTDERHLESVWVDPDHRRTGVLRTMLQYLAAIEPGVRILMAWILDGNDDARAAYERLGFESTGERQPLTKPRLCVEERLRLDRQAAISDSTDS
ncbi:ribosomal protein S18 acetylase RimI-like enzyme [Kribbella voronezhensis]|uniref:Ribosomal protein S18 acetylase RimI-like enzyme n=1 Tax=Kribbella voronezhensis TaxID=2512212 RepID=A0A4R7T8B6_9ACTN|nr:ribosomal protein S18 acetylase RimI-like enzyme [Kribbella voronezhensis]